MPKRPRNLHRPPVYLNKSAPAFNRKHQRYSKPDSITTLPAIEQIRAEGHLSGKVRWNEHVPQDGGYNEHVDQHKTNPPQDTFPWTHIQITQDVDTDQETSTGSGDVSSISDL